MSTRTERSPVDMMNQYWAACRQRGEKLRRVHGLVSIGGPEAQQPKGYVIAWGVSRGYVEMCQARTDRPGGWEIQEFEPNEQH